MKFELKMIPWTLLSLYSAKLLVVGAQFVDAPVLLILAAFLGFVEYKSEAKKYIELKADLDKLRTEQLELSKKVDENKNQLSSVKLAAQSKNGFLR